MSKGIRNKETELQKKWVYLRNLAKTEGQKYEVYSEIWRLEDESYKKWLFYKNYLLAKDKIKNGK